MAAFNQDFIRWKGDDFILEYTIKDVENAESFKAIWIMATEVGGTRKIVKTTEGHFSEEGGITIDENKIIIPFESSETDETSGIPPGQYYTELQLQDSLGKTTMAAVGMMDLRDPEEKRGV